MFGQAFRGAIELADRLNGPPDDDPWQKYFWGIGISAALLAFATNLTVRQGASAWVAFISCVALFLHVHYYWSQSTRLQPYAELAKEILAAPLLVLIGYGVYRFAMHS